MNLRFIVSLPLVVLLLAAVGCTPPPPYLRGYRFAPEPAMAVMFKPGSQSPALSVLASVVGIRRGEPEKQVPPAVEIRMRFENSGPQPVTFDPKSLALVNGGLQSFAMPEVHPPQALQIAPGQTQMLSVFFPFPPGATPQTIPLDALRLRWEVTIEDKPYLQTVVFERATQLYYD